MKPKLDAQRLASTRSPFYETHKPIKNIRSSLCDRLRRLRSKSYRCTESSYHHFEPGNYYHHDNQRLEPGYHNLESRDHHHFRHA